MRTWQQLCAEPNRLSILGGKEIYRFINETDFNLIQKEAYDAGAKEALQIINQTRSDRSTTDGPKSPMESRLSEQQETTNPEGKA